MPEFKDIGDPNVTKSRKYALAFFFGCDMGDIEWYQPTRSGKVKLFQSGNTYYCALRDGERAPKDDMGDGGFKWEQIGLSYGYRIMKAEV